jgi:1,2-dihydroxy-3-keto-5-methylthiopentene dioxygenase
MSRLTICPDDAPLEPEFDSIDGEAIADALGRIGVRFERWNALRPLPADADDRQVLELYAPDIERLMDEAAYQSVDVARCLPDNPQRIQMRAKFLNEHTHDDDEVRFFVEGAGMFYLRVDGRVYMTRCERNDLIGVPAGTRHWFDMGPAPYFTAIRLFTTPDGWVARFTGDAIAARFPAFDDQSR